MADYLLIDPQETLDYTFDWGPFMDESGSPSDTILSSAWAITPANAGSPSEPVLSGDTKTADTTTTLVANCAVGQVYRLTNTVVTAQGRTAERTLTLRCEQR